MPDEEKLSAEDQAYFDSKGEDVPEPKPGSPSEPEAQPPEAEPTTPEAEPTAEKPDTVPLATLLEERKQAKQTAKELKERISRIEEENTRRWDMVLREQQQQLPQPAPVEEAPDRNVDIFAHAKWQEDQIKALQATVNADAQAKQQETQAQQAEQNLWNYWHNGVAQAQADTPDFREAANWLSETRIKELQAYAAVDARYNDPQMVNWHIDQDLKLLIATAAQQHKNPAQLVYEYAKQRGYTGPAPKPSDTEAATTALEKTEQAISGSTSLSSVGGSAPSGDPDAAAIANMSAEQFDAWFNKAGNKARFRKLAGG